MLRQFKLKLQKILRFVVRGVMHRCEINEPWKSRGMLVLGVWNCLALNTEVYLHASVDGQDFRESLVLQKSLQLGP